MSENRVIGKENRLLIWQRFKGTKLIFSIICGVKEYTKWKEEE